MLIANKFSLKLQKMNPLMPLGKKFNLDPMVKQVNFKILQVITMHYIEKDGVERYVKVLPTDGVVAMVRDDLKYRGTVTAPVGAVVNHIKEDGGLAKTDKLTEEQTLEVYLSVAEMRQLVADGMIEVAKLIEK